MRGFPKKTPPPKTKKFTLNEEISFDKNQWKIKQSATHKLDSIAQLILTNKPSKIIIAGHTDNTGSARYNKTLSEKRAKAIQVFIQKNLPTSSTEFAIRAMGEEFPIQNNDTELDPSRNRRVEIIILIQ